LVCEGGIFKMEAINNLLVPQSTILAQKPQIIVEKTRMYCTNCHKTNHNVETCKVKGKEGLVLIVSKVTIQQIKVQRPMRYSYHICGDIGQKIIDFFKYNDMHNRFKNKGVKPINKQAMVEPKVSNPSIHMVDMNMAITRSKVTEEHVFKDRKPIKKKFAANWEEE